MEGKIVILGLILGVLITTVVITQKTINKQIETDCGPEASSCEHNSTSMTSQIIMIVTVLLMIPVGVGILKPFIDRNKDD